MFIYKDEDTDEDFFNRVDKLEGEKFELLKTALYAIECIDNKKLSLIDNPKKIEILSQPISFEIKLDGVDVTDETIEW
jgi:hypothetical protein